MKNARLPEKAKSSAAGVAQFIKSALQFITVLPLEFILFVLLAFILWGGSMMQTPQAKFTGTNNPRHLRAIAALMKRPMPREELDKWAGCSNGPELIAELRRRGLEIKCPRIRFTDRDGKACHPGVYHFTNTDRRKINKWLAERGER